MKKMFVLILTLQLLWGSIILAQQERELPRASHFQPSEITNLTPLQEHQLQLKALKQKTDSLKLQVMFLELIAKSAGNEFYSLVDDEKSNRECTAVIKAYFDSLGKLSVQVQAASIFYEESMQIWAAPYEQANGDWSKAFQLLTSGLDGILINETIYSTLRDEYYKSESGKPNKILMYGIPKSEKELQVAIAQLMNDPHTKQFLINLIFATSYNKHEGEHVKIIISHLALIPGKLEILQKIYDQVVLEVVSLMADIPAENVNVRAGFKLIGLPGFIPERVDIFRKLEDKIKANPDLKSHIPLNEPRDDSLKGLFNIPLNEPRDNFLGGWFKKRLG